MLKKIFVLGCLLNLSACAQAVYATLGDDKEIYRGQLQPELNHSGTMTMSNSKGRVCSGSYHFVNADLARNIISVGGVAAIRCNDGVTANMRFHTISKYSGWGAGQTSKNEKINFTFGMSEDESRMYLNMPEQSVDEETAQNGLNGNTSNQNSAEIKPLGFGTGFLISEQGHILTNNHVVNGCEYMQVRYADGTQEKADILFTDSINDLAVVKVNSKQSAIATFPTSSNYRVGDDVIAYGYGMAGELSKSGVLTTGTINALSGWGDDSRFIQISATVQHGNSGGPLVDRKGNVIGVNTGIIDTVEYYKAKGQTPENAAFSVKELVMKTFLKAHSIPFTEVDRTQAMSNADLGDMMRKFSVWAMCYGHPKKTADKKS